MRFPSKFAIATAVATAGTAGVIAYGMNGAESQLLGRTLVAPPDQDQLALTFDDGPNPGATPRLLDVLAERGVRATFFLIGEFVRLEPGLVRRIAAAGHRIGNHTMTHPFLPRCSAGRVREELGDCNRALEDTLGQPVGLFRAPHGGRSPTVFREAAALGLRVVQWNLMVDDWTPVTAETILGRMEVGIARNRGRRRGTNIVLHDGGQAALGQPRMPTVAAVEMLLERLPVGTRFVAPAVAEGD